MSSVTDLEITRACAQAMGFLGELEESIAIDVETNQRETNLLFDGIVGLRYDPLYDDAQAMALVKRFELQLTHHTKDGWLVAFGFTGISNYIGHHTENTDLNRAICECVAKMQKAK